MLGRATSSVHVAEVRRALGTLSATSRDRWFTAIASAAFLFATGVPFAQTLTAQKYQTAVGQPAAPLTGIASLLSKGAPLLIIALCATAIALSLRALPRHGVGLLLVLLLPWIYLFSRDEYLGIRTHVNFFCYPLIFIAGWMLRPRLSSLQWLGYLVGAVAVLSLVLGWLVPAKGLYQAANGTEISPDKQLLHGILVGPLSSGNNLGQYLVMGFAPILLIRRRGWRYVLLAASIYAQLWAASRSCLAALGALCVLLVLVRVLPKGAAKLTSIVALGSMVVLCVALPFITTNPTSFSNRGYVWEVSKKAWSANRYFGLGSTFYDRIALTSSNLGGSVFHGHNQVMQDLVTGGYVLALLMGLVMIVESGCAVRLVGLGHDVGVLYLVGFVGACMLEVSYVIVDRYFAMPVVLIPFAAIAFTADLHPEKSADGRVSTALAGLPKRTVMIPARNQHPAVTV